MEQQDTKLRRIDVRMFTAVKLKDFATQCCNVDIISWVELPTIYSRLVNIPSIGI